MNNDLISRSALLEEFKEPGFLMSAIIRLTIENAPAIDAEPVRHGYWIAQDNTRTKFMCSDCKARNYDGSGKYCPNCGAKMDAEVQDD